ncbi:MAG TPA: hypothetical protein VGG71_13560 [Chitinophagaceae bacterium]
MKTNLLIATAIFFSAVTFGQQTGSDANVQASANTSIKSGASGSVQNQVISAKKHVKKSSSSVEKKASGQAKSAIAKSQEATEGARENASLQASSGANAGSGNNKLSQDASLNAGLKASSRDAKNHVDGLSQEGRATVQAKTNESPKTTASVKNETDKGLAETTGNARTDMNKVQTTTKSGVDAGSSTAVKTAGTIKKSVKPQPASIRVHTQIKANAGIKIK